MNFKSGANCSKLFKWLRASTKLWQQKSAFHPVESWNPAQIPREGPGVAIPWRHSGKSEVQQLLEVLRWQWSGLDGCSIIAYLSFCNPQGLIKSNRLRCCSTLEMQYVSFCSAVFCGSVRHLYASDSTLIQRQHANARGGESTCDSITKIRRRQMQAGPLCDPV